MTTAYDVRDFGALGVGGSTDGAGMQAAADAANAAGGGIVSLGDGDYGITTRLTPYPGVHWAGTWRRPYNGVGTKITWRGAAPVGSTQDLFRFVAPNSTGIWDMSFKGIAFNGGWNQVEGPNGLVSAAFEDCYFSGAVNAGIWARGSIEQIYGTRLTFQSGGNGNYGMYLGGGVGSPDAGRSYIDKSYFRDIECSGQSVNGVYFDCDTSTNIVWEGLRLIHIAQDAFVLAGGARYMTFINLNNEYNGYRGSASAGPTTGSITTGTPTLVVGSASGFVIDASGATFGSRVTVQGAGANGTDLYANVTNISGTTITLSANAGTTVAGADVTFNLYCDFKAKAGYTAATPAEVTFIDAAVGSNSPAFSALRYGMDASGFTGPVTFAGVTTQRPIYDPNRVVGLRGTGQVAVRHPNNYLADTFPTSSLGGDVPAFDARLVSPPGKNLLQVLIDSLKNGSGTYGSFDWRQYDSNRTLLAQLQGYAGANPGLFLRDGVRPGTGANVIFQGSGAPGLLDGNNPAVGSIYFRTDTPSTANQRIYICTVGGGSPTWVGIV
jgi:hypothetical protein